MLKKYFQINTWVILVLILVTELIYNMVIERYLFTDKVVFNSLAEQLTMEQINTAMVGVRSNSILIYVVALVQPLVEIALIAICINIGTLLVRYSIKFKQIFGIVVKSFLVFTLAHLPIMFSLFFRDVEKLEDINYIPQFSLAEWIGEASITPWALYPLQLINLFQLGFILLLTAGLNYADPRGYGKWFLLTLCTYGVELAIMVLLTGFFISL